MISEAYREHHLVLGFNSARCAAFLTALQTLAMMTRPLVPASTAAVPVSRHAGIIEGAHLAGRPPRASPLHHQPPAVTATRIWAKQLTESAKRQSSSASGRNW